MDSLCDKTLQRVKGDQWLFSRILFIYYFTFVRAGSSLLPGLSPSFGEPGYSPAAGLRHLRGGFSVAQRGPWCVAPAEAPQAQSLWRKGLAAACHVESSQCRDGSRLPHWQADSFPLRPQGSPRSLISEQEFWGFWAPLWQLWMVRPTLLTRAWGFRPAPDSNQNNAASFWFVYLLTAFYSKHNTC